MEGTIEDVRRAMGRRARGLGFDGRDAALLAGHFLDAELRGAATHGVGRMRWIAGLPGLDPRARPRVLELGEAVAMYHASGSVVYIALAHAIDRELEDPPAAARVVVVSDCFPTGRLGYFAARAAAGGLMCLLCASSTPRLAHPAGGPATVGTNPFCLALPDGEPPVVIDVSMGRITFGDVLVRAASGSALPAGSAVRPDGSPEEDPAEVVADRAAILPFGGEQAYKAFALAAIVELLCGCLGGVEGHAAVAVLARPQAEAGQRLRDALGGRRMPGDAGHARLVTARERGTVALDDELWRGLDAA